MFKMWSCSLSSYLIACFLLLAIVTGPAKGNDLSITSVTVSNNAGSPLIAGSTGSFDITCSINLTCNGNCNDTLNISWTHNDQAIDTFLFGASYDMDIDLINTMGDRTDMSTLTSTTPVNISHAGIYRCNATLSTAGSSMNSTGTVNVTIPTPTVTASASTNPAIVGSNAQLICAVTLPSYSSYSSASSDLYVQVMWSRSLPSIILPAAMNTVNGIHMFTGVSVNDSGAYTCTARVFYNGTSPSYMYVTNSAVSDGDSTTLDVKFPTPTVSADTNITDNVLAGGDVELLCNVTLTNYSSSIYGSVNITVTWDRGVGSMNYTASIASQTFSRTLTGVSTNGSGDYACTAQVIYTGMQSNIVNSNVSAPSTATTLNVKIPAPIVSLTSASVAVGTNATITCTVTISPFVDLNGLNYMTRTVTPSTGVLGSIQDINTRTQSFTYTINNAMSTNGRMYTCTVGLSHSNATIIASDDGTGTGIIYVSSVTVTPETVTRLDVSPYNEFTLNCTVTITPSPNNPQIMYLWTDGSQEVSNMQSGATENILNVVASVMGSFTYTCNASITVNGADGTAMPNDSTSVTIKGPSPPVQPQIVSVTTTPFTATITWNVSAVSYTPESYTIMYNSDGFSNSTIANMTALDPPLAFITATNIQYTYTIQGLSSGIQYNYSIISNNTNGSNISIVDSFVTSDAAPSAPSNVTLTTISSSALRLSWDNPTPYTGDITDFNYTCRGVNDTDFVPSSDTQFGNFINGNRVVILSNLKPFREYSCNVTAATSAGVGPPATVNGVTGQAAPSGPPLNFTITPTNSSYLYLTLAWNLPSPETANGIITSYSYVCYKGANNLTFGVVDGTSVDITFTSITPFTNYSCNVSASTVAGTGPPASQYGTTAESAPTEVTSLVLGRSNDTSFNVMWSRPATANGVIRYYTVSIRYYSNMTTVKNATTTDTKLSINQLRPEVPYVVSVNATTNGGTGPAASQTNFTKEGEPGPVRNVTFQRISPTSVNVSWMPLTLEEAKGFVTGYTVTLTPSTSNNRKRQSPITMTAEPDQSYVVFTGLSAEASYSISVSGSTAAGTGESSSGPTIPTAVTPIDKERWEPIPVAEFAAHTAKLHSDRDLGFEDEYKSFRNIPQGSYTTAKLPENVSKNRFENVYSYDSSRVELTAIPDKRGSDYINASFIDGYKRPKAYIAAQGPLSNTVGDFWRMVWEFQLPTIVMLTELIERGIDKCTCYWPRALNETMDVGYDLQVTLVEQQQYVDYKLKKFLILNTSSTGGRLDVTHYHFLAWPDHGVPADKTIMLAFIRRVRQTHPPEGPPLIVHCSAGVGRTGTFITLDSMQQRLDKQEKDLNIYEFLANMRTMRVLMVQTEAQYVYIHDALSEYITCGDTSMTTKRLKIVMDELTKVSEKKSGYEKQLELINQVCRQPTEGLLCDALSKTNIGKNRFPSKLDTLPYDMTRVRLRTASGTGDYINANHVDGYKHRGAFLATQAPMKETVEDLWRMVWEQWSSSIVMLCNLEENEKEVCAKYWPDKVDESVTYGKMVVKLVSEEKRPHYIIRKLMLSQESTYINVSAGAADHLMVTQFHYVNWAEDEKPKDETPLLKLIDQLLHNQMNTGNKAITVMCSDGIGRTGSFMCMYSVLERIKIESVADVFQYIKGARFNRPGLVQNVVQYEFCHDIILEYINSFDAYHNF
uniref:protein-tyrosine-phosphatase n=1 Tax=Amphimedon queenslandica TaxID=400682 RepID=A0A1X7UYG7_AMPQE